MGVTFTVTVRLTVPAWAASVVRAMGKGETTAPSALHSLLKERAPAGVTIDSVEVREGR